jgi:hypothetical protein
MQCTAEKKKSFLYKCYIRKNLYSSKYWIKVYYILSYDLNRKIRRVRIDKISWKSILAKVNQILFMKEKSHHFYDYLRIYLFSFLTLALIWLLYLMKGLLKLKINAFCDVMWSECNQIWIK